MGSNYFGNLSLGPTNNSSRKGKKSNSDKPQKQPQRGLGVAQLEKIRLHSQIGDCSTYLPPSNHLYFPSSTNVFQEDSRWRTPYSSSSSSSSSSSTSFGFPVQQQSFMMGLNEMGNIRFPDSVHQRTPIFRWNDAINESPYLGQPSINSTPYFLNKQQEDLVDERRIDHCESNEDEELDLELRLAL